MTITYKLKTHLCGRAAVQLNWELNKLESTIYITGARSINGKSLVGILSGNFRYGDIIKVNFDKDKDETIIRDLFKEVAVEV